MIEELRKIESFLLGPLDLNILNLFAEKECTEYSGYNFEVNNFKIKFRKAKITPKKVGQFVTLWKRNSQNQTEPFNVKDDFDFYVIATAGIDRFGFFIFPKDILSHKHILTNNEKGGKRGFRVYPSWDIPANKMAEKAKSWQSTYFIDLTINGKNDLKKFKSILGI